MENIGTYNEQLSCGGTLKVSKSSWEIIFYFSGPDLRYNGTIFSIPGVSINDYISALEENYNEYEKLKELIPKGDTFSKIARMNMIIGTGAYEGVWLTAYHMDISSRLQLREIIKSFRYAVDRAPQIQKLLESL